MDLSSKQALIISAFLHAAIFMGVLIIGLVASLWNEPEEPHVFSLVAVPDMIVENETSVQPEPPQRMSYDDFVQQFGKPTSPPIPKPAKPPVTMHKIDVGQLAENLSKLLIEDPEQLPEESLSIADRQALSRYITILKSFLNRAWDKPEGLGGQSLEAKVRFIVEPDGRITAPSLVRLSGNVFFDNSVLAAFATVSDAGPTPGRTAYTLTLTFRMVD